MTIAPEDITFMRAATENDADNNGGRMTATKIIADIKNNLFPDVKMDERASGSTKYRKLFIKVASEQSDSMADAKVFLDGATPAEDVVTMIMGTQTDVQANLASNARHYGCGFLSDPILAGATTILVDVEPGNEFPGDEIFKDGDLIRISNKANVLASSGTEEFVRLAATGGVVWNGTQVTLTFESGATINSPYNTTNTRISSVSEVSTIVPLVTGLVKSGTGVMNSTTYPIQCSARGAIQDTWTLTFTSSTEYSVTGATFGTLGTGSRNTAFSVTNTSQTVTVYDPSSQQMVTKTFPYFTISPGFFGGTWSTGNTIVFTTVPASVPIWLKRVVPIGSNAFSGNFASPAIVGSTS